MYLYGASGHAKVVIEILEKLNIPVSGLFDDDAGVSSLLNYKVSVFREAFDMRGEKMIITIGNNETRKKISEKFAVSYGKAVHSLACVSPRCRIGEGTVIMAGVTVNADTIVGKHCIINTNASADHECIVGDFAHISPNATLCGGVEIGEGTHIGAGAVIIPGIRIGKWCVIGAGAVIIRDVPDKVTVVGNPGKIVKRRN